MEDSRFCVICGGPFDVEGDVYNIDPKDMRFQVNYLFSNKRYRLLTFRAF